jgi:hypothetical protein
MSTPLAAAEFSDTTPEERRRFLRARKGDEKAAANQLRNHLKWRAASLPLPDGAARFGAPLPPWIFVDGVSSADGTPLFFALGSMYDGSLGTAAEYILATAAVLDAHLPRDSETKITLLIDVRGNKGWPNPPPGVLFPYIRAAGAVLGANFPERLARAIIFPVPWVARAIWAAARVLLDPDTASKFVLLGGGDGAGDPVPTGLAQAVGTHAVDVLAARRQAARWRPPAPEPAGTSALAGASGGAPEATAEDASPIAAAPQPVQDPGAGLPLHVALSGFERVSAASDDGPPGTHGGDALVPHVYRIRSKE